MSRGWFLYMLDSNSVCELCGYFPKAVAHIVDSGAKSKPDSLQALLCTDLWLRPTECSGSRVGHHRLALRNDPAATNLERKGASVVRLTQTAALLPGPQLREPWGRTDRRWLCPVPVIPRLLDGAVGPGCDRCLVSTWYSAKDLFYGFLPLP